MSQIDWYAYCLAMKNRKLGCNICVFLSICSKILTAVLEVEAKEIGTLFQTFDKGCTGDTSNISQSNKSQKSI